MKDNGRSSNRDTSNRDVKSVGLLALGIVLSIGLGEFALAAPASGPASKDQVKHSFEDLLVQGKYHFSDEAVTTVEEDKVLDALIGVRKDFKDRIEESAAQR